MFDSSYVKSLGQSIISLDGDRVFTSEEIEDEKLKQNAKICSLILEEATAEYIFKRPLIGGKIASLDEIIENLIELYDLNLKKTNRVPVIDEILSSNGYFEKSISDRNISNTDYRILGRTEKGRVQALLNLHSNDRGFSVESMNASYNYDESQNIGKLVVKFKKIPFSKRNNVSIFDLEVTDRIEYAKNQLSIAREIGDEVMTKYWNDIIENMTRKASILSKKVILSNTKNDHSDNNKENKVTSYKTSFSQYKYAEEQLEAAKLSKDIEMVEFWGEVIAHIEASSFIYFHENELQTLYKNRMTALKGGNLDIVKQCDLSIKKILEEEPLSISHDLWTSIDRENRRNYISLKIIESDVIGTKEELDYWESSLKLMDENSSQFDETYQEI